MNDHDMQPLSIDITDLQTFAAQLRHDITYVLQPACDSINEDVWAVMGGDRPNQALGNHELNPAAQWIGGAIELNLRDVANHVGQLIESMRYMAEFAEAIAAENQTIDAQNAMDLAGFGQYATAARAAVEQYRDEQVAKLQAAAEGGEPA